MTLRELYLKLCVCPTALPDALIMVLFFSAMLVITVNHTVV